MAQEVGVAYVTLLPSGKGFGKAVEGQADSAFKGAEKKSDGFFAKVGKGVRNVALGVAGVATAVAGMAVAGGISRALNIEDAQAKLKGLGHDTKSIEAIMTDALASVKGTAFGLDTAATVAATAVAAGIKPGQELEKYLRLTADAATIAGTSMEEMGSILNKATTAGKVYTQELNQLADRGLPIFQWLQEEYGVTAEELRKMVAAGKVDAETFRRVIEENIGGAALASGDTVRGAFANMRAALSRLGLVFVEDGVGSAKQFFNEVTVILDGLTDRARPFMEKFREMLGDAFNFDGLGERFLKGFDRVMKALSSGPLLQFLSAFQPLLPVLTDAAQMVGGALGDAFRELGEALKPLLPILAEAFVGAVVELTPALSDLLVALLPLIPPLADLLVALTPIAVELLEVLLPAITWLIENGTIPLLDSLSLLADVFSNGIVPEQFVEDFRELGGVFEWLRPLLESVGIGLAAVTSVVTAVLSELRFIVETTLTFLESVFASTWEAIGLSLGGNLKMIVGLVTGDMELLKEGVQQGLDAVAGLWSNIWLAMATVVSSVWHRIAGSMGEGVSRVLGTAAELNSRLKSAFLDMPGHMKEVGRAMIQGLIDGVRGMIDNAVRAVHSVGGAMLDGIKGFLGIKSPSRIFRDEVGKMVGLGLLDGLNDHSIQGKIDRQVNHMVSIPEMSGLGGRTSIVQNNNFAHMDPMIAVELGERRFERTLEGLG